MWKTVKKAVDICLIVAAVYVFVNVYFEFVRSSSDRAMTVMYDRAHP